MSIWAVILAAGSSSRLAKAGTAVRKQFLPHKGMPLFWHSALAFKSYPGLAGIVFVFPEAEITGSETLIRQLEQSPESGPGIPWKAISGGERRQDSVRLALGALPPDCRAVLIHDAARPFLKPGLVARVARAVMDGNAGVVPGVPVTDTIKEIFATGLVRATPDRASLRAVQTPQGFLLPELKAAHAEAEKEGWTVTDDAALLERCGMPVLVVEGQMDNIKITNPEDLPLLRAGEKPALVPCTGFGYDVHRYGGDRPFILGGVPIATDITITAHSDGDTLLHALMDAMLGCVGLGDIGSLFPDTDAKFDNISSGILLAEVLDLCQKAGLVMTSVDVTVVAQVPRISPHRESIAKNLAKMLRIPPGAVNVKATTEERLGFTGEKKGLKVVAVVSGLKPAAQPI